MSYRKLKQKVGMEFPIDRSDNAVLQTLSRHTYSHVCLCRFRPNIIIEGQNAWEEDGWRQIQILSRTDRRLPPLNSKTIEPAMTVYRETRSLQIGQAVSALHGHMHRSIDGPSRH